MSSGLKPYPRYRDSGIPWLGEVPEHWEVHPNRALYDEHKDLTTKAKQLLSVTIAKGVIRQSELIANSSKKDSSNEDKSRYKMVLSGDIAYNKMRMWQGAVGKSDFEGIVSPAYIVVRPRRNLNPAYCHYLLRTTEFIKEAHRYSYGICDDQLSLRFEDFKQIASPLPSPKEQSSIVRYLRHKTALIDRYIRQKKRMIALLEEQKRVIIDEAVTGKIDIRTGKPYPKYKDSGVEWLGMVPEGWEIRRARNVCSAIVDCKNRTPRKVPEGGYTVIRTTCVHNGQFSFVGSYRTDQVDYDAWTSKGAPEFGDILFTREAPAGEACLLPDQGRLCLGQRMMYLRPDKNQISPGFLVLSLYGRLTRTYIRLVTNGSTVGHLRLGHVNSLPVLWCPLKTQDSLVKSIAEKSATIDAAWHLAKKQLSLLQEYRTRLISDVVTGKIDVRAAAADLLDFEATIDDAPDEALDEDEAELEEAEE